MSDFRTRTQSHRSQAHVKQRKTMDGFLDAAQRWMEHHAQVFEAGGFSRGFASPCHFFHNGLQINVLVHGDYIFIVGRHEDRKHALNLLRGGDELSKVETLGPGSSQSQTVNIFGKTHCDNGELSTSQTSMMFPAP